MKTKLIQKPIPVIAIAVLCWMGMCSPFSSPAQEQPAAPPPDTAAAPGALPPGILPTSPLAQVIRLMQAGVDENVIMTYVTNSGSTFNLNSDKIIYLKDVGLPNEVVSAMMQRDQELKQQMTASAYQPPAQPAPETTEPPEVAPESPPVEPPAEVTVNYFYDTLTPYGTWVDVDGYGRCWRPSVMIYNPGWQPYGDHGHWVYTDCGWYWSSDYSWGWAPFHYGRWFQVPRWGWCWTPDTVWGPSWVTWRYSDNYCGWAPLPPHSVYREGVGFFYNGVAVGIDFNFGLSLNCFTFVPIGHFCDPHPHRFRAVGTQVTQIYNHTTVINNFDVRNHNFVNHGIDPEHIATFTHTPIHPISIRDTASPSGHGPRGDQLSHDGRTLVVNRPHFVDHPVPGENRNYHPMPTAPPNQYHSPQPNGNQPSFPTRQIRPPQVPVITTRDPQERNGFHAPNQTQRPLPPANYPTPGHDDRTFTPRAGEQAHPPQTTRPNSYNSEAPVVAPHSNRGQPGAPEASRNKAPVAVTFQPQPQHNQPSPPAPAPAPAPPASSPRSSGQNQNQNSSGNNANNGPGNGSGHGSGNGSGHGPGH